MTTERAPTAAVDREQIRRWKANLETEIDGIAIYRLLAEAEKDRERKAIFEQLAEVEVHHERVFREKLREAGVPVPERGPSLRARTIGLLARRFGVRSALPIVPQMGGGGVLDGVGRVRLDAGAEGTVRAADRAGARGAGAEPRGGAQGTGADLPREGAFAEAGGRHRNQPDGGPEYRARDASEGGVGA